MSPQASSPPPEANQLRREQRADGPACVLAVGTANPANCIPQDEYADWYFRVTKSDHLAHLKDAMKKACEAVGVQKRYFQITEDLLRAHPEILDPALPSIDARLQAVAAALPELAAAAAAKAIADWGRPAGDITHLVVSTSSGAQMPGIDVRVASLLGLRPTVRRTMIYFQGCTGGAGALRVAKDAAENNRGARVLVACSEITLACFNGPDGSNLVGHALFGDGAGAVIVGAGPLAAGERPLFEMISATQTTIPGTEYALGMQVTGGGIDFHLAIQVPMLLGQNVERCLLDAFTSALGDDACDVTWNDLFWAVHPGGRPILDKIETVLKLEPEKLAASRHVLREYGNMSGATIVFVLDELRQHREEEADHDHRLPEWGAMLAFGPGITIETMVLHAPRNPKEN